MTLDFAEKRLIAARARTLSERLGGPGDGASVDDVDDPSEWLDEWQRRVGDGEFDAFLDRLDASDRRLTNCRRAVDTHRWPADEPLPDWVDRVDDVLDYVAANQPGELSFGDDEVPFSHVLDVVVAYASDQVDWDDFPVALSEDAVASLEAWLLDRLRFLFAHPLFIEFKTFVAKHDRELAFADDPEVPESPRRYYSAFVASLFDGELASLFAEYAVLARLLVRVLDQWVGAIEEFGERLGADRGALRAAFGDGGDLGGVADVELLGDRHRGGRRVFGVSFESGVRVAYKPRGVGPEAAFDEFASWVNDESSLPDLRTLDCVTRDDYGWMEWVDAASCASTGEVAVYYRRAGVLLCLLYALNFTDGHLENIVAAGDQPVLVDLETIAQPDLSRELLPVDEETRAAFRDSVLRTGLLPIHLPDANLEDFGGLAETEATQTDAQIPEFERTNTDVMELVYRDTATIEGESLPHLDGEPVKPDDHVDALADGFERAYRFVAANRDRVLADDGPLTAFEGVDCRFLYRATQAYRSRLMHLSTPSDLRTGLQFGCRVEGLAAPFAAGGVDDDAWPVYEAERRALWRLDVPRLVVRADDTDLFHDGERVASGMLEASPLAQIRDRVRGFDGADLSEQLDYLDLAYRPDELLNPTPDAGVDAPVEPDGFDATAAEQAREILGRVHGQSRRTGDGDVTWMLRESFDVRGLHLQHVHDNIWNGRMGVGVYAAAMAAASGVDAYGEFAGEVVGPLVDELDTGEPFAEMDPGAGKGVASLAYGFTKVGELLDADWAFDAAGQVAATLDRERFESSGKLDVLNGTAGAVLALLAVHDHVGDDDLVEQAAVAGEYLLENRVDVDGHRAWRTTVHDEALAGVSHGMAGIALALVELADATGDDRFRDAAFDGIAFERDRFSPDRANWPRLHPNADADYERGWCAGRAGGVLARLSMYETTGVETLRRDAERALDAVDAGVLLDRDHLCCGNAGRVDALTYAGGVLDEPAYREQARSLAASTVERADAAGGFSLPFATDNWYNPTLFLGESGVGYALLRAANPELPCLLRWE